MGETQREDVVVQHLQHKYVDKSSILPEYSIYLFEGEGSAEPFVRIRVVR